MQIFTDRRSHPTLSFPTTRSLTNKSDRPNHSLVARWVRDRNGRLYCQWVRQ